MDLKNKYPKLYKIALKIADDTCREINKQTEDFGDFAAVESEMPYKAQWVLEEAIKILQERV
jgi:hypothetical protein